MASAQERSRGRLSSPELLIVLLGDYWHGCTVPIPSAALVAVLNAIGVSDGSARAALSRLARRGVLEVTKEGRRTSYRVTASTRASAAARARTLMRFGMDWPGWDGRWTCVAFSLAEDGNRTGPILRSRMRRLGMAQLYDGVWVSPHDVTRPLGSLLAEVGVATATVLRAEVVDLPAKGTDPVEAWDLASVRAGYRRVTVQFERLARRLQTGRISVAESLVERTFATATWRQLVYEDPRLPRELLPAEWPIAAARDAFVEVYDGLGPFAEARAREVVEPFALIGAARPRHHLVSDLV